MCGRGAEYHGSSGNSCNLGSINLYNIVDNPFTPNATININKLCKMTELGVMALDEILDYGYETQPLEVNRIAIDNWRAIGLGVFGLADALVALGISYGSEESIKTINTIMSHMLETAVETSATLAKQKGTFGKYNWEYVKKSPIMKLLSHDVYSKVEKYGLRNGSLLSIAPTGSISTMVGLSGGVEPLYAISYERTTHALEKTGQTFRVFAKSVEHLLKTKRIMGQYEDDALKEMFPYVITSHDINPLNRVKFQAAMQKYVDNAISSTVNLKNEATIEDIYNAYLTAWETGCKGLTIFRDGCARLGILGKEKEKTLNKHTFDTIRPAKRSDIKKLNGCTIVKSTACVPKMYITINTKDNEIFEVFTAASTGCKSNIGNITRLASLNLRSGVAVEEVINELRENQCPACSVLRQQSNKNISLSCGNAIAEAIEEVYSELKNQQKKETAGLLKCPSCGESTLRPEGKCFNCSNCGFSKCD